jgi:hypothetical protein
VYRKTRSMKCPVEDVQWTSNHSRVQIPGAGALAVNSGATAVDEHQLR